MLAPCSEGRSSKGLSTGPGVSLCIQQRHLGCRGQGGAGGPTGLQRQLSCAAPRPMRARGKAVGRRSWKGRGSTMAISPLADLAPGPGSVVPDHPPHPKGCRPQMPCHGVLHVAKESRPSCGGWQCAAEGHRAGVRDRALQGSSQGPGQLSRWEEGNSRTSQLCRAPKAQEAGGGPGMLM